jgi:hypothetical protein
MKTLKSIALFSLLLFFSATRMNAQGRTFYDVDYWSFEIPCTGEYVWGTVIEEVIWVKNGLHFIYNGELKCFETGNVYSFHENYMSESIWHYPDQTFTRVYNFTLMSKTGAKYMLHSNMHITYNSDGTISTSHDFENIRCFE